MSVLYQKSRERPYTVIPGNFSLGKRRPILPCRPDKRTKQRVMIFFVCGKQLRVPLDTNEEPFPGTLDGFNRAILGMCGDNQTGCDSLDALVMEGVCIDLRFADDRMQASSFRDVNIVTDTLMVISVLMQ